MSSLREVAERRRALVPYEFPWHVPVIMYGCTAAVAVCAAIQRGWSQPWLAAAACLVALIPILVFVFVGYRAPQWVFMAFACASVALFFTWPPYVADGAPYLLMFAVGEVGALSTVRAGLAATAASIAFLFCAHLFGHLGIFWLYPSFFVATGWLIGRVLQLQQRLLMQERAQLARMSEQAAADERRRIAREIHDVIAHSLSVTLLHVTGARRALQQDHDIDDAVTGLMDAERLGRQAMSDIRGTVGLLSTRPDGAEPMRSSPQPGLGDIPELVADFTAAGLTVDTAVASGGMTLSAGAELALFRVAQESLANIAKHSPGSAATVLLVADATDATLTVSNGLVDGAAATTVAGSGISGMRQRVQALGGEFHAGPENGDWTVRATVPLDAAASRLSWLWWRR